MTGSGSAVFGIFSTRAIVERVVGRILGTESIYAVHTVGVGLRSKKSVT
jgi:4-diphosphocytidyl-2C-methyl-D-erythritol kinase